jgi:hypothetical protein
MYIDWAFKTSFITATHNVGPFKQTLNYNSDNISSFESYINEVKPYRTTVREYISRYDYIDLAATGMTDFDLPASYSYEEGKITPIDGNSPELSSYPWKWWTDNHTYSVTAIAVNNPGSGYDRPPNVEITGDGFGALAKAYIANGEVTRIEVINAGSGYLTAPKVEIKGGNPSDAVVATAVAFIGDSKARLFDLTMKFDRISKTGLTPEFTFTDTFTASGEEASYRLTFPANAQKYKIKVIKNDHIILGDAYDIEMQVIETDKRALVSNLVFSTLPSSGDLITITYEKHDSVLDAVDRIEKYYNPTYGMRGKFLSQLVTGIDFGGVQIQGATFDITGGWDTVPWGSDTWDSIEPDYAHYHYCSSTDAARTLVIKLPYIPNVGQQVNVYIKAAKNPERFNKLQPYGLKQSPYSKTPETVRIDDIAYTSQWDSASTVNPYAVMPTFIGDGLTDTVEIGTYFETFKDDIVVLRLAESDGSIAVDDPSIIDSNIQGGSLAFANGAYVTATGVSAEEIAVDGGVFIGKAQVPATEENVPGQVLESLSIKVFDESANDSAPLHSRYTYGDDVTTTFAIGLPVIDTKSVLVTVDKVKQILDTDYTVNIAGNSITFNTAPSSNKTVVIISLGVGGADIQSYNTFVADGKTAKYTTTAMFKETNSVYVTVDGVAVTASFSRTSKTNDKVFVVLSNKPAKGAIVNVVCFKGTGDGFNLPIVNVKEYTLLYTGNNTITVPMYDTTPSINAPIPMIMEHNGTALVGVDVSYAIYDGFINEFLIERKLNPINSDNIKVYVNGKSILFVSDYTFTNNLDSVIINKVLNAGDKIMITNDIDAQYTVSGNEITIDPSKVVITNNDTLMVTWFTNHETMQIVIDETIGGKARYNLPFKPLAASYAWVYKNGIGLIADRDYSIVGTHLTFATNTVSSDVIKIVLFGANLRRDASAFEITKDMFNVSGFTRFSMNTVKLAQDLNYYDKTIVLTDTSDLYLPVKKYNSPGVVYINGERIQYFEINGNTLTQLRRGVLGTSIAVVHPVDSYVVDVSVNERLPYKDTEHRTDVISDGISIGIPVDFIPVKSNRIWEQSVKFPSTIPTTHGPCDQIEVFVAGRRLRKNPMWVFNPNLGANSPAGDVLLDAEFSVDGESNTIRLTELAPVGTRVTVFYKTGKIWYEQGDNTASKGLTLLENSTSVASFIARKSSLVPN